MIRVEEFYRPVSDEISVHFELERFLNHFNITREQIISITHTRTMGDESILLVYEEKE